MILRFVVPGKPVSNNRNARIGQGRSYKSKKAESFQQRVFQHAFAAAQSMGWEKPEACAVTIDAYNVRLDVDNIPKITLDGMQGAAYHDDKVVIDLRVRRHKDLEGERLHVSVEPREALVKPKKGKAA